MIKIILAGLLSCLTVLFITPIVIKLATKLGFIDSPDARKVHKRLMPRMGGLSIIIGMSVGFIAADFYSNRVISITVGSFLIFLVGLLDDKYTLSPKLKLFGQIIVSLVIVRSGLLIEFINLPIIGRVELEWLSVPITILWMLAIINAVNLIDGLDGLASGITIICAVTIATMAGINGNMLIFTICIVLIGSLIGFLKYNFYPAKIFLGDSGSLLLGYWLSVISLLGLYKSVTLFSIFIPILILGVPIFDTLFAIVRRLVKKLPVSHPDKSHIHHLILKIGYSHKQAVLIIYLLGIIFSVVAVFANSINTLTAILIFILFVCVQLLLEKIGLIGEGNKPLTLLLSRVIKRELRKTE